MAGIGSPSGVIRFGDFEVDVAEGHLRKRGVNLKLRQQSFEILQLLLERPGGVVTREELRRRLWPDDLFLDFDNNLNSAMARLREALSDSAEQARYIETLPKRGYRFVGSASKPSVSRSRPAVAVLPFANLSADQENEYFSDGLADEIITALARIPGLQVTARTSSFAFRGREQDVRQIGAALGVSTVLEGSVQRSGGRVRVSAQLVDASNGFHLWSERFDRELADVFGIQDEISQAIARALEVRLAPTPSSRPTVCLEAYQLWLKGRHHQRFESQFSNMEAFARSKACYQQAIALDPSFPQPYLGLAELNRLSGYFGITPAKEAGAKARAAIRKVFELDGSLGEAYALSGAYRAWLDFDWRGAEDDFNRAAALSPAAVETHWLRTMVLIPHNRMEEAVQEMERAIELDPLSPGIRSLFAWLLGFKREFGRALAESETALALAPEHPVALALRGSVLYFSGRIEDGVVLWQSAVSKMARVPSMLAPLGYGLARLGRKAEARAILAELDAAESELYVTPFSRALVYIGLGEFDTAFEWLNRAVDERDIHILHLTVKPVYDPIRQDPRFRALLRKMRLQ